MIRNPHVAILAAHAAGTGVQLSASEVADLRLNADIAGSAANALNEDGHDMVRRFGWGHLRYYARNTRATQAKAMRGLPAAQSTASAGGRDDV